MMVIPAMNAAIRSRIAKPMAKASVPPMTVSVVASMRTLKETTIASVAR